jgi:caffeoyl-CoA O-methyltransferase
MSLCSAQKFRKYHLCEKKQGMQFLPENIEAYTTAHTEDEPPLLQALTRETWQKVVMPRMLSGQLQGRFLAMLSSLICPQRVLEVGTFTGYSALCFAEGLAESGTITTIEINDELQWLHKKYFTMAGLSDRIQCIYGDALEVLPKLEPVFDLIFLDADKERYPAYYEECLRLLSPRGVLVIDNVLWSGKVTEPATESDRETMALQSLNARIHEDERVRHLLLPVRDGMMMVMKVKQS